MHDELLTMREVSDRLRVPLATLRWWRSTGRGPKSFSIGRQVRYRAADVDQWLATAYQETNR